MAENSSPLYCDICDISLQHTRAYLAHCNSMLHNQKRAKLEEQSVAGGCKDIEDSSNPEKESAVSAVYESSENIVSEKSADESDTSELTEPEAKKRKKDKVKKYKETNFDIYFCQVCDISCTGRDTYITHCGGRQHCKKYLVRQNEIGFEAFRKEYGDPLYDRDDEKEPPPDIQDDYFIHVYRSGVFNKLFCRACDRRMFTFKAWYDHMLGDEHGKKMVDLVQLRGGSRFMTMFGDLPGPNPHMSSVHDQSKSHRRQVAVTSNPVTSRGSYAAFNAYGKDEFGQPSFRSRDQQEIAISRPGIIDKDERRLPGRFEADYDAVDHDFHAAGELNHWTPGQNSISLAARKYFDRQRENRTSEHRSSLPVPSQFSHEDDNFRPAGFNVVSSDSDRLNDRDHSIQPALNPCRTPSALRPGPPGAVSRRNQNAGHVISDEATSHSNFVPRGGYQALHGRRQPPIQNYYTDTDESISRGMPRMPTRNGR